MNRWWVATLYLALVLGAVGGCNRGARSPAEAYDRFAAAVRARDGVKLFEVLDQDTRWSWMTTQRSQRESYDILLSAFPEGVERTRELARFEAGATSEDADSLFARAIDEGTWAGLSAELVATPSIRIEGSRAVAEVSVGRQLVFQLYRNKYWGFSGLAARAEETKRRAVNDLQVLRTSAADYERAAARAGK